MTHHFASLPRKDYQLALMDPAWATRNYDGTDRTPTQKRGEDHYPTMTLDELKALEVGEIMAKNSLIAMWVISSHLDQAFELARHWGFTFRTDLFIWLKQKLLFANQIDMFTGDIPPPKMSMGRHTRNQAEACWLFGRGKGLPVLNHDVRQVIIEPPTEHSRKPAEQYDRLARLYGEPEKIRCLEMFSRTPRKGWDAWGNEVGKFAEKADA
ncbi:MT-A70 family methyltransferase [Novosphingobium clariflavum]|uniref:MT-A70 family methyltransferase n=1 Tax=Novosphingobium clariflavum TaxID=2029884 RepID=A0ABV6S600_9SPHN|nr:MT-A70 family methyltransferase [Novosphingobium clariflavum]